MLSSSKQNADTYLAFQKYVLKENRNIRFFHIIYGLYIHKVPTYMKFTKVLKDASCYGVGNAVEWGQFWVGCYCGVKLQFVHITRG